MSQDRKNWVVLAHLLRPQGRRGELLADLLTDFPERFQAQTKVFLAPSGFDGDPSEAIKVEITSSWLPHGRNEGRIVLGFSHASSIAEAEPLAGFDVVIPDSDRLPLEADEVYIDSLVGCLLYDRDAVVGTVLDVQFITTADGKRRLSDAAPLLTVETAGGEALIPFAKEFLVRLDVREKRLWMKLPSGLLDLNLARKVGAEDRPAGASEAHRQTDR